MGGKDARTLARELLAMTQEEFARAFSRSPMKRAQLGRLERGRDSSRHEQVLWRIAGR